MINEIEALAGILILVTLNYLYIYKQSRILGCFGLLIVTFALLPVFSGTDYEMIAIIGIFGALVTTVLTIAHTKQGAATS